MPAEGDRVDEPPEGRRPQRLRPLFRYRPGEANPLHLDTREPSMPVAEFALAETRYASLARSDPDRSAELLTQAQDDADERWHRYVCLAAPGGD